MSGTGVDTSLGGDPLVAPPITSPEYLKFMLDYTHRQASAASGAPPGVASLVTTAPNAPGMERFIPGFVSGAWAGIDKTQQLVRGLATGTSPDEMRHIPGGAEAEKLSQGSTDTANRYIPHMQPRDGAEQDAQEMYNDLGRLIPSVPSAVSRLLPAAARGVATFGLMGPKASPVALVGGALTAGMDADNAQAGTVHANAVPPAIQTNKDATTDFFKSVPPPVQLAPSTGTTGFFNTPVPHVSLPGGEPIAASDTHNTLTWGQTALGLVGTVAVLRGVSRIGGVVDQLVRSKYFSDSAASNAEAALNAGVLKNSAPLPPEVGAKSTAFNQYWVDDKAVGKSLQRAYAPSPALADQWVAEYGELTGNQAVIQRFQAGAMKGELGGQKMPSLTKWQDDVSKLTPAEYKTATEAFNARDELDNRKVNGRTLMSPTDADTQVRFKQYSTQDLNAMSAAGMANPKIKAIVDTAKLQTDAMAEMLQKNGMFTVSDAMKLKANHTTLVPGTDIDGMILNPLASRKLDPGSGSNYFTDPFLARAQHDFTLYAAMEKNKAFADIVTKARAFQSTPDPITGALPAKLFQDSKDLKGAWVAQTDKSSIPVRINGELQHVIINDPGVLNAMRGSPLMISNTLNAMNKMRQITQSGATGTIGVLSGNPFPVTNLYRSAHAGSILAPKEAYKGPIDKLLARSTGGAVRLHGDPSAILDSTYRGVVDPMLEVSRFLGETLHADSPSGIGKFFRNWLGDDAVNYIQQRGEAAYANSIPALRREAGLLNSSPMTAKDVASNAAIQGTKSKGYMPLADVTPELHVLNGTPGMNPTVVRLKNLFDEVRAGVSDGAHSAYFARNLDNPNLSAAKLNYSTRQLTGDPGSSGAGKAAKIYSATTAFGNVSMQEDAALIRASTRDPWQTIMGFMGSHGLLAAASLFSSSLMGPETVKHQFDSLTDKERSESAYLYPTKNPADAIRIPLGITTRGPYNLMLQLGHDIFGLQAHDSDHDLASRFYHGISDLFSKHVWQSTFNGSVSALSGMLPPAPVAPTVKAGASLAGIDFDPNLYDMYMHRHQPIQDMIAYNITGDHQRMPGQNAATDPLTGTQSGVVFHKALENIFAIGGSTAWDLLTNAHNQQTHNGTVGAFIDNALQDYRMRVADKVPGLNALWGQPEREMTNTPLNQRVQSYLDVMRPTATFMGDSRFLGYTRKGGPALPEKPDGNAPKDPAMLRLYATVGRYMNLLDTKPGSPLKEVQDARKAIGSLDRSPLSPATIRTMKNQYIGKMEDANVKVLALIHRMNSDLSKMVGQDIDVKDIDFHKGMDQFQPHAGMTGTATLP